MPRALAIGLLALVLVAALAWPPGRRGAAPGAEALDAVAMFERLRPAAPVSSLLQGAITTYPVAEHGDREIAAGLALFVGAPPSEIAAYLGAGRLVTEDPATTAAGLLPEGGSPAALAGVRFTGEEREDAEDFLEASPGARLNLSPAEIEALRGARQAASSRDPAALVEIASAEYQRLLADRWEAYQRAGVDGIAPYARGRGALTDAARDLRSALADVERLAGPGAALGQALARPPASSPAAVAHRLYWIKREVQGRPWFGLLHIALEVRGDEVLYAERHFYTGHSYDAAQIALAALPYRGGALVLASGRLTTDAVAGLGGQLKRSVGRSQFREQTRRRLEELRSAATAAPRPVAPVQAP